MKLLSFIVMLMHCTLCAMAQPINHAKVTGQVLLKGTTTPVNNCSVLFPDLKLLTTTNLNGNFYFDNVPFGVHRLQIKNELEVVEELKVSINKVEVDLGSFWIAKNEQPVNDEQIQNIPSIELSDNTDDESLNAQYVSGIVTSSKDPYYSTAAYTFSNYGFRLRGYGRNQQEILINGLPMNDVETGDETWALWGGLNDIMRSKGDAYGLQVTGNNYGKLNGGISFVVSAARQPKQAKLSYSLANKTYRNRVMLTYSSGLLKNGWAYAISASKRWAKDGYVPGTFYDGYALYAAVSKQYKKHLIDLTVFGSSINRGKMAPVVDEAFELAGTHFYNPNWGYQNGEKRNAKVANSLVPTFLLSHEYAPNARFNLSTTLGYQFGKIANATLDWYNTRDPRPDYYRYLPSYALLNNRPEDAAQLQQQLSANPGKYMQIDWDRMYQTNYANTETINDVNGIAGNNIAGKHSVYALANDVDALKKVMAAINLQCKITDHVSFYSGLQYALQRTESYREIIDLLGGDFYLNLNQFAIQQNVPNVSFNQYDLNTPNRLIKEGDKYNYDYISRFNKLAGWGQLAFSFSKIDFFIAANIGSNTFSREGLFRNGLFPEHSFGKSELQAFINYGTKGGVTYKINGRNYLFLNGFAGTEAPTFDNTFISPRTRNIVVNSPTTQKVISTEGGYLMRAPDVNLRVVGYLTAVKDATTIKRFYNDDPSIQGFVNYVLQHVNTRFMGTELAMEVKLDPRLSVRGVASVAQAFYTNNPIVGIYRDNDTMTEVKNRNVYIKNYNLATGPQTATSIGFNYKSGNNWRATINCNYFDRNYIDINPERRTVEATELVPQNSELYNNILTQEKAPAAFTLDLSVSKPILLSRYLKELPRNTSVFISIGIYNLLNNTNVINGGYEQLRYDLADNNPDKFPRKYIYAYGRNYFINLSIRF